MKAGSIYKHFRVDHLDRIADALLAVQAETARECGEMLETKGVLLPILPGETKNNRCIRFARAFAVKIRAHFGLEGK